MNITYLGHGCFYLQSKGIEVMIDPFISGNPLAKDIDISAFKPQYVLITHGHGDHVADVETIVGQSGALIVSNFEIVGYYGAKNLKGHPLNHGGKASFEFGTCKYVNAIHTSSFPDGTYAGNPGGFVIWNGNKCVYFAGDTALTRDFELIPETCPPLDLAVFPIGDNFTMGYEDACLASDMVKCNRVLGCHYNTFDIIQIDTDAAQDHFRQRDKDLILLEIGQNIEV